SHYEPRGTPARAALVERNGRRANHARIAGESEVVVRREGEELAAVDDGDRALHAIDDPRHAQAVLRPELLELAAHVIFEAHGGDYIHPIPTADHLPMQNRANTSSSTRSPTSTPRSWASARAASRSSTATTSGVRPGLRAERAGADA